MPLLVPALSLAAFAHDALVVAGIGAALLAGIAVIYLGLLLPGLLTWTDGRHGRSGKGLLDPAPGAPPVISEPARRRLAPASGPAPVAPQDPTARGVPFLPAAAPTPLRPRVDRARS